MKQINSSSWFFLLLISSSNEIILYMKYLQHAFLQPAIRAPLSKNSLRGVVSYTSMC